MHEVCMCAHVKSQVNTTKTKQSHVGCLKSTNHPGGCLTLTHQYGWGTGGEFPPTRWEGQKQLKSHWFLNSAPVDISFSLEQQVSDLIDYYVIRLRCDNQYHNALINQPHSISADDGDDDASDWPPTSGRHICQQLFAAHHFVLSLPVKR